MTVIILGSPVGIWVFWLNKLQECVVGYIYQVLCVATLLVKSHFLGDTQDEVVSPIFWLTKHPIAKCPHEEAIPHVLLEGRRPLRLPQLVKWWQLPWGRCVAKGG